MKVCKVEIIEAHGPNNCWEVIGKHRAAGIYGSACEALNRIKDVDMENKEGCITIIEWTTVSRIGKAVVLVLGAR